MNFNIRPISEIDLKLLYEEINYFDNEYTFIFNIKSMQDIRKWFKELDPSEIWLVISLNKRRIGFVSFDGDQEDTEIQIFLKRNCQNKGNGAITLMLAEKWIRNRFKKLSCIYANIKHDNLRSINLFESANYVQECDGDYYKYFY